MKVLPRNFDAYTFSKQPGFNEATVRTAFAKAVPLRTLVVYCYDPRAVGAPAAVARELGEVHPGELTTDARGRKVASTASLFEVVVAGGRAIDALRSITIAQHLFGLQNVVLVHHTHCGGTTFTPEGITRAFEREHDRDISGLYERESLAIRDLVASLRHDAELVRNSRGTPAHVNVYGFVFDIDTGELTRVVEDRGLEPAGSSRRVGRAS